MHALLGSVIRGVKARPAWLTFAVALVPRLIFLVELRRRSPTFFAPEGGDSILYDRLAQGAPSPAGAYFHSPLYIELLKGFYRVFGRDLFALRLAQHVLGAAACALVAQVTRRAFRSTTIGLGAGIFAALMGPIIFYEGQIGVDALMPFLVMASVALAVRAFRTGRALDWALVGITVGVAALGRAVVLIWLPLLLFCALGFPRLRWRRFGALLVGAAVAILPVTLHNWRTDGDFVLVTANGGLNFYIGNHEAANGGYVLPQGVAFRPGDPAGDFEGRAAAEAGSARALTAAEVSAWWTARGWAFVRAEPGRAARLVVEKAKLLVTDAEVTQLHDYDVYREVAPILDVLPTAGFVIIPGLAGLIAMFATRRRGPLARRLAWLALAFAAGFLPFFVVGRYRAPWLLLLAPFAAAWLHRVVVACRDRAWRSLAVPVLAAAATAWIATLPVPVPSVAYQYLDFARAALAAGDRGAAEHWVRRAVARDPAAMDAVALLGRLLREDGHDADAEAILADAARRDPRSSPIWLELGRVRIATGDLDSGITALLASVDADPRSLEAWSALAQALRRAGRVSEAAAAERSLEALGQPVAPAR